jgi:sugar phosphate isomerase/epimerase
MNVYLKLSKDFNLSVVEVRFEKERGRPSLWPWEADDKVRSFLERFEVAGAHLPFVYIDPISLKPRVRVESVEQLRKAIRKAAEFGITYTVMHARGLAQSYAKENSSF